MAKFGKWDVNETRPYGAPDKDTKNIVEGGTEFGGTAKTDISAEAKTDISAEAKKVLVNVSWLE